MPLVNRSGLEGPTLFPTFARLWACATLLHQLAFSFWAQSWPGWVLVIVATAVLGQPSCLYRFGWLIIASLINLFSKMPFVPNHILFEGLLHLIMLIGLVEYLVHNEHRQFFRDAIDTGWRLYLLLGIVALKAVYHLAPIIPKTPALGIFTTALLVFAISQNLYGRKPIRSGEQFIATIAPVIRIALMTMYFWAVIQKLNFDYFNPDISCAAKLHKEIAHYFGGLVPTKTWALYGAIFGSLIFELLIPILLFIPRTRVLGFFAAVWFHLWLAIHPAAGIFSFSALILAMLYLFLPTEFWRELTSLFKTQARKLGGGDAEKGMRKLVPAMIFLFFAILVVQITLYLTMGRTAHTFDTANRVGFVAFALWGLWLGTCYLIAAWRSRGKITPFPNRPVATAAWIGLAIVILNGASPWLGGKTQTAFSMYSNLRSEGETNHFFLKRVNLLPYQNKLVKVIAAEPNIFDPSNQPRGISNFANRGHLVMPFFELRRLVSSYPGDVNLSYEQTGEVKRFSRVGDNINGDELLTQKIPLLQRKILWFRRLNALEGPMPCTH